VLLFGLLWFTTRKRMVPYLPSGVFLLGYGLCRFLVEHFRTPEIVHSWAGLDITQGQLLSLPMIVAGLGLMVWAYRKDN
jgi:phosphatidylglycerol:prolipoprotein diacylglycerol transferase